MSNKMRLSAILTLLAIMACIACSESFEERCRREALEYTTKQCPRMLDSCTCLDSMVFHDSPVGFEYCYSISGAYDVDSIYADAERQDEYHQTLVQSVRSDIGLRQCKDHGFTFTYTYVSATDGHPLMRHAITPEEYQ